MRRRFVVVKIRIGKLQEMHFYLIFSFFGIKIVNKRTMNLLEGREGFGFSDFCYSRNNFRHI